MMTITTMMTMMTMMMMMMMMMMMILIMMMMERGRLWEQSRTPCDRGVDKILLLDASFGHHATSFFLYKLRKS